MKFGWILLSLVVALPQLVCAQAKQFLYLSAERIATAEIVDDHTVLLNYFNLGTTYEPLNSYQVVLLGSAGEIFRGHLFREESPKNPDETFTVSKLAPESMPAMKSSDGMSPMGPSRGP